MSANIESIQKDLRAAKLDGWLFYDFPRARDPIAPPHSGASRGHANPPLGSNVCPAEGRLRKKLVHKNSKPNRWRSPPGGQPLYFSAQEELRGNLKKILGRSQECGMQYSPKNAIPYVSMVDAGTIELVRSTAV